MREGNSELSRAAPLYGSSEKTRFFRPGLPFFLVRVAGALRVYSALMDPLMTVMTKRHELHVFIPGIIGICSAVRKLRILFQLPDMMHQRCRRQTLCFPAHHAFAVMRVNDLPRQPAPVPVIVKRFDAARCNQRPDLLCCVHVLCPKQKAPELFTQVLSRYSNLTGQQRGATRRPEKAMFDPSLFHSLIIAQVQYDIP